MIVRPWPFPPLLSSASHPQSAHCKLCHHHHIHISRRIQHGQNFGGERSIETFSFLSASLKFGFRIKRSFAACVWLGDICCIFREDGCDGVDNVIDREMAGDGQTDWNIVWAHFTRPLYSGRRRSGIDTPWPHTHTRGHRQQRQRARDANCAYCWLMAATLGIMTLNF